MGTNLYLIRHAKAAEQGVAYPDDSLRPLIAKGHKQAAMLSRAFAVLNVHLDVLCSSPYTRAFETAQPITRRLIEGRNLTLLESLVSVDYPSLLHDLQRCSLPSDQNLAVVGHEPFLSEFASFMLTGEVEQVGVRFKKGAVLQLYGSLQAGTMVIKRMLTPRIAAAIVQEVYVDAEE